MESNKEKNTGQNEKLNLSLSSQLEASKKALEWSRLYLKGTELRNTRERLITKRIEIKRLKYASQFNPAAAVFGESQVGKSYLVDTLLASTRGPLNIYDGEGRPYGFIEKINPVGQGKESTALVSRFTTKAQWTNKDYPIRAMLLSPIDVVLVLCDSYFNDVQKNTFPSEEEISRFITNLSQLYEGKPTVQTYITEDEIFELRDYFAMGVTARGEGYIEKLRRLQFFEKVALMIGAINVEKWQEVFSFVWNNNPVFTDIFNKLINAYSKLQFKNEVYIKVDSVLREDGTILQVDRLMEFFGKSTFDGTGEKVQTAKVPSMDVWIGDRSVNLQKSEFCALAAELVFKVDDELKDEKPFLEDLDIIDFPGARSREMVDEDKVPDVACDLLIRGKVAYLFNKYSQQYLISNLLFCHHKEQSNVKTLSSLLEGWIKRMVGKTPDERSQFMRTAEISPLFIVGTKFNSDMVRTQIDDANLQEGLEGRWDTRFTNLSSLIGKQTSWFNDWIPGQSFDNLYLLRSYDYSCRQGLFDGFLRQEDGKFVLNVDSDGRLIGETGVNPNYKSLFEEMGNSFVNNEFVKRHFANPRKSWEEVAEPNHDGSDWIIENLTKSATKVNESRSLQFAKADKECFKVIADTMIDFYHDDNTDKELAKALDSACNITLSMDMLFSTDKYFFSDFIESFYIKEDQIHDVILDTINKEHVLTKTDIQVLFAIRERAEVNPQDSEEENIKRLCTTYHCRNQEELEKKFGERNIKLEDVLYPPEEVKNLGRIIVDEVEACWIDSCLNIEHFDEFVQRGMPEREIQDIIDNMSALYTKRLSMNALITERMRPYVSSPEKLDEMVDMLADLCSTMINTFVNTVGTAYFYDEMWKNMEDTVKHNNFDIQIYNEDYSQAEVDEESIRKNLSNLFDVFDNLDTLMSQMPYDRKQIDCLSNYKQYRRWTDNLKMAFLATCGIPKYDINMNNALRAVLVSYLIQCAALAEHVDNHPVLRSMETLHDIA